MNNCFLSDVSELKKIVDMQIKHNNETQCISYPTKTSLLTYFKSNVSKILLDPHSEWIYIRLDSFENYSHEGNAFSNFPLITVSSYSLWQLEYGRFWDQYLLISHFSKVKRNTEELHWNNNNKKHTIAVERENFTFVILWNNFITPM